MRALAHIVIVGRQKGRKAVTRALKEVAIYFRNATIRSGDKLNRMCLTRYVFQTGECALVRETLLWKK